MYKLFKTRNLICKYESSAVPDLKLVRNFTLYSLVNLICINLLSQWMFFIKFDLHQFLFRINLLRVYFLIEIKW